ncbi:FMN-binding domain protein [Alkaliphilus metalliredigens QYMF]|uniref:FMN-binding domain protein n=1 Tax=Alkaliphilus metalliredigens (strain QYMF) TaxID=293826 RepID=A6TWX2_ALKMQ|nr:FMN-binding protein [Alkaliphilus metalliredigens]ABR50690.1 FMN-binding domain protein [Alkaliphilus metalliredigens QYMF]
MDKKQKIAIILLPLMAIALLMGVTAMTGAEEIAGGYSDGTYTGTGKGYGGDIVVTVEVANERIASISIDEHGETPGIGDTAAEGVAEQIIASQELEVEIVTGATMSSEGLMEAVRNALAEAGGTSFPDGTHEGMASGFGGDIKVTVDVSGGKIVSINFDEMDETPGIGDTAAEQVAQQIKDTQSLEVEVVTGATMTSVAVMEAIENALN